MSLKKKLKELTTRKAPPSEEEQITKVIYEAILNKPKRSFKNLYRSVSLMKNVVDKMKNGEEVSFDELNSAYLAVVGQMTLEGERNHRKFHPSSLRHDCERRLVYSISGEPFSDEVVSDIDGRVQMIFDTGHWFHSYMQATLKRCGLILKSEVRIHDADRFIDGRMDALVEWKGEEYALEAKTMNSFRFVKGKLAVFSDNEYQNSFYASHLGIKKVIYLYYNKDTSEIKIHIKKTNETFARLANEKIDDVLEAVDSGKKLKRSCSSPTDDMAISCPFRTLCFNEATSEKTKRKRKPKAICEETKVKSEEGRKRLSKRRRKTL